MLLSMPFIDWYKFSSSSNLDKQSISLLLKDLLEAEYTLYIQLKHPYSSRVKIFYGPRSSTYIVVKYWTKLRWEYSKVEKINGIYVFTEAKTWDKYWLTKTWIIKKYNK